MRILIPTAKEMNKKATAYDGLQLNSNSMEIVNELAKLSVEDLAKVYKIKEDKAIEEFSRWQDINNNTAKSYKALELFNGLMYRNIDRDNFDEADKEYIEKNVFITTSLYGIIGAYDLIQEHRLDFLQNVKISGESLKNFWRASYDESIEDGIVYRYRKLKGGAWISNLELCQNFFCTSENAIFEDIDIGFRIVRTIY